MPAYILALLCVTVIKMCNETTSMALLAQAEGALDTLPVTYSLYGVVVHLDSGGSTMWGHYIAYVKGPDGRWFCCDDERITEVG
jgi:ubiquitin C-terminal hydrolase